MAFCLCCPFTPRPLNIFHNDCAGNPLAPISTGNSQHFHPLALQSSCNWRYFVYFLSWASSHRVSQGTVSSIITMALLIMDDNTMSGLSVVWMTFGKTSFFFRSTVTSHSFASSKIDFVIFFFVWYRLAFFDKVDHHRFGCWSFLLCFCFYDFRQIFQDGIMSPSVTALCQGCFARG